VVSGAIHCSFYSLIKCHFLVLAGDSRDIQHRWRFMPFPPDGLMRNLFGESWLDNATFYELKKVDLINEMHDFFL